VFVDGGYEDARDVIYRFWMRRLDDIELSAPNAKSVLQEWAQGRRLPLPLYLELSREGPDHEPRFTVEVQIEGMAPERGQGANKRAAEQAAAYRMLLREGVWTEPENA
jgi:ribonuclease-3